MKTLQLVKNPFFQHADSFPLVLWQNNTAIVKQREDNECLRQVMKKQFLVLVTFSSDTGILEVEVLIWCPLNKLWTFYEVLCW